MPATVLGARRQTPNGVPYTLVQGYPKGRAETFGKFYAEEQYLIPSTRLADLIADLMPAPIQNQDETIWAPRYAMPGTDFLYLKEIEFEPHSSDLPADPFGADSSAPAGTYDPTMAVTLRYNTDVDSQQNRDQNDPETFLERSLSATVELLTISANNSKVKTNDDGVEKAIKNLTASYTKVIPLVEHSYSWKQVLNPNFVRMATLLGTVNATAYPWLLNAISESVLFTGFTGRQEFQFLGGATIVRPWQLDLKFAQKTVLDDDGDATAAGWNHVYNPDTQLFQRLIRKTKTGNRNLYRSSDFNLIFQP